MNFKEELEKELKNPLSFYIITGNLDKNKEVVLEFLKDKLNFENNNNPDFYYFKELSLSMKKTRDIKRINSLTKIRQNSFKIFFIESNKIEEDSQNALLKTFEEPGKDTIFFLFIPKIDFVLDTLKSRARIISGYQNESSERAIQFLEASFLDREKMIKKISNFSKEASEVREEFLNLLREIEVEFLSEKKRDKFSKFYKDFLNLKKQANQKGSGLSYIMTFLAIMLP